MREATFCLAPAGDNFVSARFYTAIAAGCLPVVVGNRFIGAFPQQAMYDRFCIKVPHEAWLGLGLELRVRPTNPNPNLTLTLT